ncbi:hypothetical protein H6P81_000775 [Aristolochia fimbriata]|uniref:Calcineurin-like phosphoesterase domain-containing protein n=1 Tax=Aristolochia fimbriata TaxID=158543 RepID=A0AAV7F8E7_ARIFI|nr:hypothetical protein H6P81_000775 [Aristolochia fimbriata]
MACSVRIAVVGDVHDDWDLEEDSKALKFLLSVTPMTWFNTSLQPDLVLFTGDYGNENVDLVRSISNLNMAKAAIMGNHDCWNTHRFKKKKDRVQMQLDCLGKQHVGYTRLDFRMLQISVVGGRPFSCGGNRLFREMLLSERYGVSDMAASAKKIYEAALGTPENHSVIFLAHNGPSGLGSNINDICGKDWDIRGGDHGDPDLEQALQLLKQDTKLPIPLVVFGHMHKQLAYRVGLRKMIVVGDDNTIYLNGAIVPRVKSLSQGETRSEGFMKDESTSGSNRSDATLRAFTVVEMMGGKLKRIAETWVAVSGEDVRVHEEQLLFQTSDEPSS